MAMTTKPINVETVKKLLEGYKILDILIDGHRKIIAKSESYAAQCSDDFRQQIIKPFQKEIQKLIHNDQQCKENILKLLEYADSDFDRDLLRMRYIEDQSYYDIAYTIGYSEGHTMRLYRDALIRLTENAADLPPFRY